MQEMIETGDITPEEMARIMSVINKEEEVRRHEQSYLNDLKLELENIEKKSLTPEEALREAYRCTRCGDQYSRIYLFFMPFAFCKLCTRRICKNCSTYEKNDVICCYCRTIRNIEGISGHWFHKQTTMPPIVLKNVSPKVSPKNKPALSKQQDISLTDIAEKESQKRISSEFKQKESSNYIDITDKQPKIFSKTDKTSPNLIKLEDAKPTFSPSLSASRINKRSSYHNSTSESLISVSLSDLKFDSDKKSESYVSTPDLPLQVESKPIQIKPIESIPDVLPKVESKSTQIKPIESIPDVPLKVESKSTQIKPIESTPDVPLKVESEAIQVKPIESTPNISKSEVSPAPAVVVQPASSSSLQDIIEHKEIGTVNDVVIEPQKIVEENKIDLSESIEPFTSHVVVVDKPKEHTYNNGFLHGMVKCEKLKDSLLVKIKIIEGSELKPIGGSSTVSSYVSCMVTQQGTQIFKKRTSHIDDCSAPLWSETFEFVLHSIDINALMIYLIVKSSKSTKSIKNMIKKRDYDLGTYGSVRIGFANFLSPQEADIFNLLKQNVENDSSEWVDFNIELKRISPHDVKHIEASSQIRPPSLGEDQDKSMLSSKRGSLSSSDTTSFLSISSQYYAEEAIAGSISIFIKYNEKHKVLSVTFVRGENLSVSPKTSSSAKTYLKCKIIPKFGSNESKTTVMAKNPSFPEWNSTFSFDINTENIDDVFLVGTVYRTEKLLSKKFLGQLMIPIKGLLEEYADELEVGFTDTYKLTPKIAHNSFGFRGLLSMSLRYDPNSFDQASGNLEVRVMQISNIKFGDKPGQIDSYVTSMLLPDTSKQNRKRCPVIKKNNDPEYKFYFSYQNISTNDLTNSRCLEILAWTNSSKFIGGVRLCTSSPDSYREIWQDSSDLESCFWQSMLAKPKEWIHGTFPLRFTMVSQLLYPCLSRSIHNLYCKFTSNYGSLQFDAKYIPGKSLFLIINTVENVETSHVPLYCKVIVHPNDSYQKTQVTYIDEKTKNKFNSDVNLELSNSLETYCIEVRFKCKLDPASKKKEMKNIVGRILLSKGNSKNEWDHPTSEESQIFNKIISQPNEIHAIKLPLNMYTKSKTISKKTDKKIISTSKQGTIESSSKKSHQKTSSNVNTDLMDKARNAHLKHDSSKRLSKSFAKNFMSAGNIFKKSKDACEQDHPKIIEDLPHHKPLPHTNEFYSIPDIGSNEPLTRSAEDIKSKDIQFTLTSDTKTPGPGLNLSAQEEVIMPIPNEDNILLTNTIAPQSVESEHSSNQLEDKKADPFKVDLKSETKIESPTLTSDSLREKSTEKSIETSPDVTTFPTQTQPEVSNQTITPIEPILFTALTPFTSAEVSTPSTTQDFNDQVKIKTETDNSAIVADNSDGVISVSVPTSIELELVSDIVPLETDQNKLSKVNDTQNNEIIVTENLNSQIFEEINLSSSKQVQENVNLQEFSSDKIDRTKTDFIPPKQSTIESLELSKPCDILDQDRVSDKNIEISTKITLNESSDILKTTFELTSESQPLAMDVQTTPLEQSVLETVLHEKTLVTDANKLVMEPVINTIPPSEVISEETKPINSKTTNNSSMPVLPISEETEPTLISKTEEESAPVTAIICKTVEIKDDKSEKNISKENESIKQPSITDKLLEKSDIQGFMETGLNIDSTTVQNVSESSKKYIDDIEGADDKVNPIPETKSKKETASNIDSTTAQNVPKSLTKDVDEIKSINEEVNAISETKSKEETAENVSSSNVEQDAASVDSESKRSETLKRKTSTPFINKIQLFHQKTKENVDTAPKPQRTSSIQSRDSTISAAASRLDDSVSIAESLYTDSKITGEIMVGLKYTKSTNQLFITIKDAKDLTRHSANKPTNDAFVKINIFPDKNKSAKFQTKVQKNATSPVWNEEFIYKINEFDIKLRKIVINVYHKTFTKRTFLGQTIIPMSETINEILRSGYMENYYPLATKIKLSQITTDVNLSSQFHFSLMIENANPLSKGKKSKDVNALLTLKINQFKNIASVQAVVKAFCKIYLLANKSDETKKSTEPTDNQSGTYIFNQSVQFEINKDKLNDYGIAIKLVDNKKSSNELVKLSLNDGSKKFPWQDSPLPASKIWKSIQTFTPGKFYDFSLDIYAL